jgi:hypothetical protein
VTSHDTAKTTTIVLATVIGVLTLMCFLCVAAGWATYIGLDTGSY